MEYNLVAYLKVEFPALNFTANGVQADTPESNIDISEGGGTQENNHDRRDYMIRVTTQDIDKPKSRVLSRSIYDKINKKFGLLLPAATVDSVVYPEVKTWQITALALPSFIGNDENGRPRFAANYKITTAEG